MITKEVNEWIKKVQLGMFLSREDALFEFSNFVKYLTKEEILFIQKKIKNFIKDKN